MTLAKEEMDKFYLIDNNSTDETLPIAQKYLGKGLIGRDGSLIFREMI